MNGSLEARDLRLVQAIAETGGATRAARRLHLSQSAVSHQLRALEERLGVELFRREGRKLVITAPGDRLLQLSHPVLSSLLQAELELKRGLVRERPKLRVGTQCYTAYHWLPRAVTALLGQYPELDLHLQGEGLGDAAEALNDDKVDLALCLLPPQRGPFLRVPLFRDELVVAVAPGHRLAGKEFVDPCDLQQETLIQHNISPLERERVQRLIFGGERVAFARVMRLPVTDAVLDLVQAGLGVSILAGFTLAPRIGRGELKAVRITRGGVFRQWTGVLRKASPLARPIRTLLGALKASGPGAKHP